jgi:hypothetical protein
MVTARTAVRGSTGWEQGDHLKHRARPVPRTRTRLLRALLKPPALATQATPTQEHVQLVLEESTRLRQAQFFVRIVGQGRIQQQ